MKLASLKHGRDGQLLIVSRDLGEAPTRAVCDNIPPIIVDTSLPSPRRDGADLKLYSGERFQAIFSSENVTTHLKNFRHEIL